MNMMTTKTPGEPALCSAADQAQRREQPEGLIPRQWCDACARETWVVTFEEAVEIAGISPSCYSAKAGEAVMMENLHTMTTPAGATLICLESLLLCIFSFCEKTA